MKRTIQLNKTDQIVFILAGSLAAVGIFFASAVAYFQYTQNGDIIPAIIVLFCLLICGAAFLGFRNLYRSDHE